MHFLNYSWKTDVDFLFSFVTWHHDIFLLYLKFHFIFKTYNLSMYFFISFLFCIFYKNIVFFPNFLLCLKMWIKKICLAWLLIKNNNLNWISYDISLVISLSIDTYLQLSKRSSRHEDFGSHRCSAGRLWRAISFVVNYLGARACLHWHTDICVRPCLHVINRNMM